MNGDEQLLSKTFWEFVTSYAYVLNTTTNNCGCLTDTSIDVPSLNWDKFGSAINRVECAKNKCFAP